MEDGANGWGGGAFGMNVVCLEFVLIFFNPKYNLFYLYLQPTFVTVNITKSISKLSTSQIVCIGYRSRETGCFRGKHVLRKFDPPSPLSRAELNGQTQESKHGTLKQAQYHMKLHNICFWLCLNPGSMLSGKQRMVNKTILIGRDI